LILSQACLPIPPRRHIQKRIQKKREPIEVPAL
jgi:hypothetical protein